MRHLLRRLDGFWFAEAPASRLAMLRILVGAYALWYLVPRYRMFVGIGSSSTSLFEPVGVATLLGGPLPPSVFQALVIAMLVANVVFLLGWWYRISGPLFAGLLLGVLCYRNSWSMIYHSDNVLVFHVLILGLSRAADGLSLDALRRRRLAPESDWRFGWPIRLMCAVTVLTYFLSGMAKVAGPLGWSWATGEALRSQVAVDGLRKDLLGGEVAPLAYALFGQVFLFTVMGVGSLAMELGAPVALVSRRFARFWAANTFLMHWGILFVMGIKFRYQLSGVIFASFFPLERIAAWCLSASRRRASRSLRPAIPPMTVSRPT